MTKEEALHVLLKMRKWRAWGRGEQNNENRPEMPEQKEVDNAFDVCIEMLSEFSSFSNLKDILLKELKKKEELYLKYQDEFRIDDSDLATFYEGKAKMCTEFIFFLKTLKNN